MSLSQQALLGSHASATASGACTSDTSSSLSKRRCLQKGTNVPVLPNGLLATLSTSAAAVAAAEPATTSTAQPPPTAHLSAVAIATTAAAASAVARAAPTVVPAILPTRSPLLVRVTAAGGSISPATSLTTSTFSGDGYTGSHVPACLIDDSHVVLITSEMAFSLGVDDGPVCMQVELDGVLDGKVYDLEIVYPPGYSGILRLQLPCTQLLGLYHRGWRSPGQQYLTMILSSTNKGAMTSKECLEGRKESISPSARSLPPPPQQQQLLPAASPRQRDGLQHSSIQLQPQQQPDHVAGLQQQPDAAAAASERVLEAYVHDSMSVKLHKSQLLLAYVLACTVREPSIASSVRGRVSNWDGPEVTRFQSTTYAYLRARYLANDAPAMCVVIKEILQGII